MLPLPLFCLLEISSSGTSSAERSEWDPDPHLTRNKMRSAHGHRASDADVRTQDL